MEQENKCQLCHENPKDWNGTDPKCAFKTGIFSNDNYCCTTMREIRKLIHGDDNPNLFYHKLLSNNENVAIINIEDIPAIYDNQDTFAAISLWVQWYKRRGCTEQMLIMFSDDIPPRPPTESECRDILRYFNKLSN